MVKDRKDVENAEQRIFDAAVGVFLEKGYDGARMQEIAERAGINKALLHYYYRSKERLFKQVFVSLLSGMISNLSNALEGSMSFEEKLYIFSREYIGFLQHNPQMPIFLLNEIRLHPQLLAEAAREMNLPQILKMYRDEIFHALGNKNLDDMQQLHSIVNIISLLVFPVAAQPVIQMIFNIDNDTYSRFLNERKTIVPNAVLQIIE